jgi:hypothetical protein
VINKVKNIKKRKILFIIMSDQPHYERNTAVKSAVGKGGKGIPGKASVGKFAGSKGF